MTIRPYTTAELAQLRLTPQRFLKPQSTLVRTTPSQACPQNLSDQHNFSCGIRYLPRGGQFLTLARYNQPSHENGDIAYRPHIHRASEMAIACLAEAFNVYGLDPKDSPTQLRLPI